MTHARRQVELVLTFLTLGIADIESSLPRGVLLRPNSEGGTLAIIGERRMSGLAVEALLEELWTAADPILDRLQSEGTSPDALLLRLVQYIGRHDEVGPGVPIDARWIKTLAQFDGVIDIDQYVENQESGG